MKRSIISETTLAVSLNNASTSTTTAIENQEKKPTIFYTTPTLSGRTSISTSKRLPRIWRTTKSYETQNVKPTVASTTTEFTSQMNPTTKSSQHEKIPNVANITPTTDASGTSTISQYFGTTSDNTFHDKYDAYIAAGGKLKHILYFFN